MAWKASELVVVLAGALLTMVMVPAGILYVIRDTADNGSPTPDDGRDPE
jgi:hypothetical protein